jgi:hypothetical protein
MTLTVAERTKIKTYLGYPLADQGWAKVLNDGCDRIIQPEDLEAIRNTLRDITRIEQLRHNTLPFAAQTFSAGSSQGTTQFLPGQRMASLDTEGRHLVEQLASMIGLPIYANKFNNSSWQSSGINRG